MSEKVQLPAGVVDAIEKELSLGYSKQHILTFPTADYYEGSTLRVLQEYREKNFDLLMEALVNGYVIKIEGVNA